MPDRVLYLAYASTLEKEVSQNIGIHGYADDHALRKTFSANSRVEENIAIKDMEDSSFNIKSWMDANRLKMNGSKTEFIMFGHRKLLQKCITISINIDGDSVNRLHIVKYLGALLDEELTLKQHKCKSAMYGIHRIKSIRSSLTEEAAGMLHTVVEPERIWNCCSITLHVFIHELRVMVFHPISCKFFLNLSQFMLNKTIFFNLT